MCALNEKTEDLLVLDDRYLFSVAAMKDVVDKCRFAAAKEASNLRSS